MRREGDVSGAVAGDAKLGQRVAAYLSELTMSGGFDVRHTDNMHETAA